MSEVVNIFVVPEFYEPGKSKATGGQISNYHLIKAAAKTHKTYIIAPNQRIEVSNDFDEATIVRLDIKRTTGFIGRQCIVTRSKKKLAEIIASEKINKFNIFYTTTTIPVSLSFKSKNIRNIIICRAYEEFIYGRWTPIKEHFLRVIAKKIADRGRTKRAYATASDIIVNSKWLAQAVEYSFSINCEPYVLYPPLDIKRSFIPRAKAEIKNFVFGFVNRGEYKGLNLYLKLAGRYPTITFKVYGDEACTKLSNIQNCGWQDRHTMFSECSCFLVPSVWPEPFGRVAIEANAYGLPVVTSKCGGLPEANYDKNLSCPVNDFIAWEEKINYILHNYSAICGESLIRSESTTKKFGIDIHDKLIQRLLEFKSSTFAK